MGLSEMSYEDFGRLRFLDHFEKNENYHSDELGGTVCGVGLAYVEGYPRTAFARTAESKETAEIKLDFDSDCPEAEGNRFLNLLKLGIRKGTSREDIYAAYKDSFDVDSQAAFPILIVGAKDKYYVGCGLGRIGVFSVWIASSPSKNSFDVNRD